MLKNHVIEASQYETIIDNALDVLNPNIQDDEQPLVDMNYVDGDGSINQRFIPDKIITDFNDNMNDNIIDDSPKKENDVVNSENNASTVDENNISKSNINVLIAVLNGMSLPPTAIHHSLT